MKTSSAQPPSVEQAFEHYRAGNKPQAEVECRQVLASQPNEHRALHLLGVMALEVGRDAMAGQLFVRALNIAPHHAGYYVNLATALHRLGKLPQCIATLTLAIEVNPELAEAHFNLARALDDAGDAEPAFDAAERAALLDQNRFEIQLNYARRLQLRGENRRAIEVYRQAVALDPASSDAHLNLASVLRTEREFEQARSAAEQAIHRAPNSAPAHLELGRCLVLLQREGDAIAAFQRAITLDPSNAEAHTNLGFALETVGEVQPAVESLRASLALTPDDHALLSSIIFLGSFTEDATPQSLLESAHEWHERFGRPLSPSAAIHSNDKQPNRRLRVGYVSDLFYGHCQSFFTLPLLRHHDRERYEIICYSSVIQPDARTDELRAATDVWRDVQALTDTELVQRIREDQIDVLVDLSLHMGKGRLRVFAHKPAPVQICWLAYPGTTGLSAMDYRITDRHLDPPDSAFWPYSEQSLVLPDTFWCYDPLTDEVEPGPLPAIERGFVTFGSLNHVRKVNATTLRLWARVLRSVTHSRLLLHAPSEISRANILRVLSSHGIEQQRVTFVGRLQRLDYLKTYRQIDIALDTFPCQGHTTSLDAFWMGVPVVSLLGPTLVGRAALTLSHNIGLQDLVRHSEDAFVQAAVRLASDLQELATLRSDLRPRMQSSPLMDARRFASHLEAAYRAAWQRYCEATTDKGPIVIGS
jgi:predicted O-linked N-acetylglucosamine transferase (SPINDLY family)